MQQRRVWRPANDRYPLFRAEGFGRDRLAKVADRLDVSVDWLLGRTNVMSVMEMPELAESPKGKAKKNPHG
jgi:hypothetical protein